MDGQQEEENAQRDADGPLDLDLAVYPYGKENGKEEN